MLFIITNLIIFKTSKITNTSLFILIMFNYDKTRIHTFQTCFLYQDIFHIYDQFLPNILMQTPHVTEPEFEKFPHQSSRVNQILLVLGTLADTISTIWNLFLQNDPTNHIQKDLDLLPIVFCSVLDQFSSVENSDRSQLLTFPHFLQNFFQNYPINLRLGTLHQHYNITQCRLSFLYEVDQLLPKILNKVSFGLAFFLKSSLLTRVSFSKNRLETKSQTFSQKGLKTHFNRTVEPSDSTKHNLF